MEHYYSIFKHNRHTGKTTLICGGTRDTEAECRAYFRSYTNGFMDSASVLLGYNNYHMMDGTHDLSFIIITKDKVDAEYFMLLDKAADDLIKKLFYV